MYRRLFLLCNCWRFLFFAKESSLRLLRDAVIWVTPGPAAWEVIILFSSCFLSFRIHPEKHKVDILRKNLIEYKALRDTIMPSTAETFALKIDSGTLRINQTKQNRICRKSLKQLDYRPFCLAQKQSMGEVYVQRFLPQQLCRRNKYLGCCSEGSQKFFLRVIHIYQATLKKLPRKG